MDYNLIKLFYNCLHIDINKETSIYENKTVFDIVKKLFTSILTGKMYLPRGQKYSHFFFFATRNQYAALEKIRKTIFYDSYSYFHGHDVPLKDRLSTKYPFWLAYLLGLFSYILYFKSIQKIKKKLKLRNSQLSYQYLLSMYLGHYFLDIILLRIHKPRYLWMSNDHTYLNVAFLYAAKKMQIKSIYLQHASVSSLFPPLSFDYAFLDGDVAYQTYKEIGIKGTTVFLSGISKMDNHIGKYDTKSNISKIMICINQLDDVILFEKLINELINRKYSVKLRKHPYMSLSLNNENRVEISKEKTFIDSLNGVDLVVAGDSNVHLEATLSNIPCFYFATSKYFDYYGFLKNGLVIWGGVDFDDCLIQIQNYQHEKEVYLRAKPYCASVGMDFENQSTTFILNKLGINGNY